MWRITLILLVLASAALAQSSSDGSFSVRHSKKASFSLSPAQMREAENLYRSACAVVEHDFHSGAGQLHPHLTVVIGAARNEVHAENTEIHVGNEIWMKKWEPTLFAQGVVVLAFGQMLTVDVIKQLGNRAVRYSNATVDVAELK
jgi:hypothetical protein